MFVISGKPLVKWPTIAWKNDLGDYFKKVLIYELGQASLIKPVYLL